MWYPAVPYNFMPMVNYNHAALARTPYCASADMVRMQMSQTQTQLRLPLCDSRGTKIQGQNTQYTGGSRKFLLDRSVYDLVKRCQYLESTDPKLLGWYLSLSASDRKFIQDEGGLQHFLQSHPALEWVREYACVNLDAEDCYPSHPAKSSNTRPTLNGVTSCLTCGENLWPGEKCRHCNTSIQAETSRFTDRESDLLSNSVTDNLSLVEYCSCKGAEGATYQLGLEQHPTDAAINSQDSSWPVYNSSHLIKEQRHSDMETHASKVQLMSQLWDEASQKDGSNCSCVNAYKDPSAQASFSLDVELENRTAKPELVNRPTVTQTQSGYCQYGETSTLSWTHKEDDNTANTNSWEEATSMCEGETEYFHSIMEEDESILECKMNPRVSGVNSAPDSPKVMVSIDTLMGKTSPGNSSEVKCSTAEKSTSPLPPTATYDISVITESNLASCRSAATQTKGPDTADKMVNTAVYMSDLDYLMEIFTHLRSVEREFKELKAKMTRSGEMVKEGADAKMGCNCAERAKQAELSLLALQYRMCQQHCWRNTAERDLLEKSGGLPANLASVLQTLESDYKEMRQKIQAGVTLDQLKPLSVSYTIGTESCYVPAQIIGDTLGNVPTSSSQQPQRQDKVVGGNASICKSSQEKKDPAPQIKLDCSTGGSVATLLPQQSGTSCGPGDGQTCEFQGMNTSEAWYDAEEDLEPSPERKGGSSETKEKKDGPAREEGRGLFLHVSNLPCTVTEADVAIWFEKYHPSVVSISTLSSQLGDAIVTVPGAEFAEAAVREMNGRKIQGHALHVEQINQQRTGSQGQAQQQGTSFSSSRPGPSEVLLKPKTSTDSSNTATKVMMPRQLLLSSPGKQNVVCVVPTARCTFVPQHYGTMGSFDTLIARLKERHPGVGREAIVGALKELRVKHRGVLSGLPLREIENMASDLLMTP